MMSPLSKNETGHGCSDSTSLVGRSEATSLVPGALPQASAAQVCIDGKCKPPGSLGYLEAWAIQLSELQGSLQPHVAGACLLLFAADHGFTKIHPAVSAYPAQVTPAMFSAIAAGQAASSVLCTANNCSLILTDVGVDADLSHVTASNKKAMTVMHRKVAAGSACFTCGPAMTQQQCQQAMAAGAEAVAVACQHLRAAAAADIPPGSAWSESQCVLCIGELGIGNTTAAAAVLAALTGAAPEEVCGRGTGIDDAGLAAKQAVVAAGLLGVNQALIASGPLGALQGVGGLELAAMAGAYLAAAERGVPVIADGFVSGVAALVAMRHDCNLKRCLFLSHRSAEKGATLLIEQLGGVPPVLDMQMRLGEGTGAVISLPVLRSAAAVMTNMASLQDVMDE